jgi:hypothetical protein
VPTTVADPASRAFIGIAEPAFALAALPTVMIAARSPTRTSSRFIAVPPWEVIEPGDASYMPPGHVPTAVAGTELMMFSPQDELAAVEAAMGEAHAAQDAEGEWGRTALFREVC